MNEQHLVQLQRVTEESIGVLLNLTAFTHPEVKNNAENVIKQLKDTQECMVVVGAILNNNAESDLASATKLVALSILNEWIGLCWKHLSELQQNEVQNFVLSLFGSPLIEYGNNSRWTKMAVILANVAERQYPQYWPMLVEQFSSVWIEQPPSSIGRMLVSMRSLEFVLTDCFDADFNSHLPSQRRQEIIAGLRDKLPIILHSIYTSILNCTTSLHSSGNDPAVAFQIEARMLTSMKLLGQICCLVNAAEDICKSEHPFESLLMECLRLVSIFHSNSSQGQGVDRGLQLLIGTLDVIKTISQYKINCALLLERIIQGMVAVSGDVSRYLSIAELASDLEDSMQLRSVYTSTVHTLISEHTTLLFGSALPTAPQSTLPINMGQLFTVAVFLLQHPSRRIAGEVLKDWIKVPAVAIQTADVQCVPSSKWLINMMQVFKEMPSDLRIQTNEIGVAVLKEFMKKCRRPLCLEQSLLSSRAKKSMSQSDLEIFQLDEQVFNAEFDDKDDWNDFFSTFKSQLVHLAQAISQSSPFHTIQMLLWHLTEILSKIVATLSLVESKCVTLDLEVFHVIYVAALASYNSAALDSSNLQSEEANAAESIILSAVQQIIQWNPSDTVMSVERLRLLTYHSTFLRRHPQLLFDIYTAIFPIIIADDSAKSEGDDVSIATRAANLVVSLTHTCAEELVSSTMLDGLLTTFSNVLEKSSSSVVKTCMRECLVSLSERLDTYSLSQHGGGVYELKTRILKIALSDVLESIKNGTSLLFASAECFLHFVLKTIPGAASSIHSLGGNTEAAAACEAKQRHIAQYRMTLFSFVSCAKKTCIPASLLPVDVFSSLTTADIKRAIPFIEAWEIVLPLVFTCTNTFHSLWNPDIRVQISNLIGDNAKTLLLPGLHDLSNHAGVKLKGVTVQSTPKICNELKDLRLWLYQTLAQSCVQRAIYIDTLSVPRDGFIAQLIEDCNYLENVHLSQFSKIFIEMYVVHAPTSHYPTLSRFLTGFFHSILRRLSFAWDSRSDISFSPVQTNLTMSSLSEQDYLTFLYRHCSIDLGYLQSYCKDGIISGADAENLREGVITDCAKSLSELFQAINGLKGTLSIPTTAQKNNEDKVEAVDSTAASNLDWQETERLNKKTALQSLLTAPEYALVTQPYVLTLLAMLSIPDSMVCKRCVSIMMVPGGLIMRASLDKRLLPFVAGDVFNTTLHILISQEKWSAGLEWELVDLLLEIFLVLHMGEVPSTSAGGGNTSEAPLRCLLALEGITREKARSLEKDLRSILVKKKRRGAFKDFLAEPMRLIRDAREKADTLQHMQGSNFILQKACPEIDNVKTAIFKYWKNDKRFLDLNQVDSGESFGLAAIFNSSG